MSCSGKQLSRRDPSFFEYLLNVSWLIADDILQVSTSEIP